MSQLPVVSWQECVKALQNAGFVIAREKRHIVMRRLEPQPTRVVPVPKHKTIKKGTLRGIIRQAGLAVDEFVELLEK